MLISRFPELLNYATKTDDIASKTRGSLALEFCLVFGCTVSLSCLWLPIHVSCNPHLNYVPVLPYFVLSFFPS